MVDSGDAWLVRRTKGAWTERATLVTADSTAGDECGVSVALGSGDAPGASLALVGDFKLALVGGLKQDTPCAADAGHVWAWSIEAASTLWTPKWRGCSPAGQIE